MAAPQAWGPAILLASLLSSSAFALTSDAGIPGSQVRTGRGSRLLRAALACYAREGQWKHNATPRKLPWNRESYGRATRCELERNKGEYMEGAEADKAIGGGDWNVSEEVKWEWTAEKCSLEPFSYENFCRTMGSTFGVNASILIVGDELSWGLERRLFSNIRAAGPKSIAVNLFPDGCAQWDSGREQQLCSGYRYCHDVLRGASVAVRFVKSSDLSLQGEGVTAAGVPWKRALNWMPTVVILTHSEQSARREDFEIDLAAAIGWVRMRSPDALVVYRNAPAVRACPSPQIFGASEILPPPLNNEELAARNRIARGIVERLGGLYFDVNETVARRPPALKRSGPAPFHGCIDVCQPGVLDAWVQLLHNLLMKALPTPEMKLAAKRNAELDESYIEQVVDAVDVSQFVRKGPDSAPPKKGFLPGSKVQTAAEFEAVSRKLDCFARSGRWEFNSRPRPLPWLKKPWFSMSSCDARHVEAGGIFGAAADEAAANGGDWNVRNDLKWEWRTKDTCPLEKFSREAFCRLMGPGRSVLFLGDSMTRSFERHMFGHMLLGVNLSSPDALPVNLFPGGMPEWDVGLRFGQCLGYAYCHDVLPAAVQIRFCFNRGLTLTEVPLDGEAPWILKLREWNTSVLLLNRGAHYRADAVFERDVRSALYYARKELPEALVVWRNTPPGHANCESYPGPIEVRQDPSSLPYNWDNFARQNEIARKYVEEIGGVYMDVDYSTALRPDGHRGKVGKTLDCLHYCLPGPPDTWVLLMFNFLKLLL